MSYPHKKAKIILGLKTILRQSQKKTLNSINSIGHSRKMSATKSSCKKAKISYALIFTLGGFAELMF